MDKRFEDVVVEINNVSAALDFISESIECLAAEGKSVNACGLAYLTKLLRRESSCVADSCWGVCSDLHSGSSGIEDS
ncbi:hypothetical protein D0S45_11335 [Marinifilum sp. JC120]|nr:hypothetical protein D0S45_11335 [Marinifilum sp. JC120]